MKKLVSLLCGGALALSLFAAPGTPVKAAVNDEDCACHDVTILSGAEKNKAVANLLSSQGFKDSKFALKNDGYSWRGVNNVEVVVFNRDGSVFVGVPVLDQSGIVVMAVFFNGQYMGISPLE